MRERLVAHMFLSVYCVDNEHVLEGEFVRLAGWLTGACIMVAGWLVGCGGGAEADNDVGACEELCDAEEACGDTSAQIADCKSWCAENMDFRREYGCVDEYLDKLECRLENFSCEPNDRCSEFESDHATCEDAA